MTEQDIDRLCKHEDHLFELEEERRKERESKAEEVLKKIKAGEDIIWDALMEWGEFLRREDYDSFFMDKDFIQQLEDVVEDIKIDIEDQE